MWRPLCLAALNTPCERASAQVFLNVLRDSLGARRAASDMLLPCRDLSSLFPTAAAARVALHGSVRPGAQVVALQQQDDARWRIDARGSAVGGNWTAYFDGVVIATGAGAAALLLHTLPGPDNDDIIAQLTAFEHESITTCYLRYAASTRLARPFFALPDDPGRGHWGQFVFDRGQLDPAHAGWLAVVISASRDAAGLDQPELARLIGQQLGRAFGDPGLASPLGYQVISEKRATFACTPALRRPGHATAQTGLVLAGDYTAGDYPATLEGAVRSGIGAAALVSSQ